MDIDNLNTELKFKASRSSGKGGQNVNKVSTQMELSFDVENSQYLSDEEKKVILDKLKNRINSEGILKITSQSERSQILNKNICLQKFYELITNALKKRKPRKKTKPPASVKTADKLNKIYHSNKKKTRQSKINFDE